jgi:hypothetical protein
MLNPEKTRKSTHKIKKKKKLKKKKTEQQKHRSRRRRYHATSYWPVLAMLLCICVTYARRVNWLPAKRDLAVSRFQWIPNSKMKNSKTLPKNIQ